jgi:hypothetical protein
VQAESQLKQAIDMVAAEIAHQDLMGPVGGTRNILTLAQQLITLAEARRVLIQVRSGGPDVK